MLQLQRIGLEFGHGLPAGLAEVELIGIISYHIYSLLLK